jgi:hypothetical protein
MRLRNSVVLVYLPQNIIILFLWISNTLSIPTYNIIPVTKRNVLIKINLSLSGHTHYNDQLGRPQQTDKVIEESSLGSIDKNGAS